MFQEVLNSIVETPTQKTTDSSTSTTQPKGMLTKNQGKFHFHLFIFSKNV